MDVIVPLFTLFPFVWANKCDSILYAYRCPGNASQWEKRGNQFQCDISKNITYHCILNSDDTLIEACIKKEVIPRGVGGCPWILEREGRLLFVEPPTRCPPNIKGCPGKNHGGYTTDSLYLYPNCFVPLNSRKKNNIPSLSVTQKPQNNTDATSTKISGGREIYRTEECTCTVFVVFMTIFIITTVLLLVSVIRKVYVNRKMNRNENTFGEDENYITENTPLAFREEYHNEEATQLAFREEYHNEEATQLDVGDHVRKKELFIENKASKWLRQRLKDLNGKEVRPIILHGISGSGKSTVAQHCLGGNCFIVKASETRHLMKSLKELADSRSIKFDEDEKKLHDTVISLSMQLKDSKLLIDDVNDKDTMKLIDPLLQTVQCVVTTTNGNLMYDIHPEDHMEIKGLSIQEAIKLFTEKESTGTQNREDFEELISILEGSPLGILSVIKHMKEMKVSITRVLRYIKQNKRNFDNGSESGKLFNALEYFLKYIKSAHPEISSLVMSLQFLSNNNIPICLLYALAAYEADGCLEGKNDIDFDKAESVVNTFISALQEVSFGDVTGVDDERKISVPPVVQITTMNSFQQSKDRRQLLLKLLKCMSWLFVKDHGDKNDHRRCMDLLPHAIEVMHHFSLQGSETTTEESLVFIQVCDQVRYTYEVLGYDFKEKTYAELLMKHVLEKFLCVEKDYFIDKFQDKFQTEDKNIDAISKELQGKCKEIVVNNESTISKLAEDYTKNKVRSENYQETLRSKSGDERLFTTCRLNGNGIKCLHENSLLVKDNTLLAHIFIYEILITALRTFGRFTLVHRKQDKTFHIFVCLIKNLAEQECDTEALQKFKSIRLVGVEFMEMEATCTLSETSNLTSLKEQSEKLLSDDCKYFKYGLFVQCPKDNLNHILRCKCVMLQCYRKLKEQKVLEECANSIKDLFGKDRATCMKASYSQKAKQELADFYIEKERYKEAIDFLTEYEHATSEVTSKSDCKDILLQCQCYQKLKMFEERSNFLRRFKFKVPTEETSAKEIIEKIKETEQPV